MCRYAFDEKGELKDDSLSKSMDKFIAEFVWLVEAITDRKHKESV
jgi:hypothetical protein